MFVFWVCIIFYALYHVANYAHPGDTNFGRSKLAKIYSMFGIVMYLTPIMFVPVDCEMGTRGESAKNAANWIWVALVFTQMTYIWLVCPVFFAFYETNDKDGFCRRFWDAIRLQMPLWITLLTLVLPSFFLANSVKIPANEAKMIDLEPNETIDGEEYYVDENSFVFHVHAVTVCIG